MPHRPIHRADPAPGASRRAWARYGARVRNRDHSLRALITHAVSQSIVSIALLAGSFTLVTHVTGESNMVMVPPAESPKPDEAVPPSDQRAKRAAKRAAVVAALVAEHDCWRGAAPSPQTFPTRSVVTLLGQKPALVDAQVGYDIWLAGAPGELHAFCL